jgi:hypothetical protein
VPVRTFLRAQVEVLREHKRGFAWLVGITGAVLVIVGGVFFKASERPWFCGTCHNMDPYVQSWKVSSHKDVGCIECHYEPGFLNHVKGKLTDGQVSLVYFLTGKTPGKYHAEISNAACLQAGCHKVEELKGEKDFHGIPFEHTNHIEEMRRGKKLRCATCHGQIVQGSHITVDPRDCFICHFKPETDGKRNPVLAACGTCHKEVPQQIELDGRIFHHQRYIDDGVSCESCHIDIIAGDGAIIENKCVECHNEPHFVLENYSAEALHLNHVTNHKVECWHCHREIKHKLQRNPTAVNFKTECTACHEEREHLGAREMYKGTGGIGVEDSPSAMYLANVDCLSCHRKAGEAKAALRSLDFRQLALGEACNACHGEGYDSMLMRWKEVLTAKENEANGRINDAQQVIFRAKAQADAPEYRQAEQLVAEARHNLTFVLIGRGHHNIEYALKLLNVAGAKTEQARSLLDPGYAPRPAKADEFTCATLCHTEIQNRTVKLGQAVYPHKKHIVDLGLECTACHSPRENHGRTFLTVCKDCHHGKGQGTVRCEDCHREVAALFNGSPGQRAEGKPSFKAGKVSCADCHADVTEGKSTQRETIAATCEGCHEKGYGEKVAAWEAKVAQVRKGQPERIAALKEIVFKVRAAGVNTIQARNLILRIEQNDAMIRDHRGLHNPDYAVALAQADAKMIQEVEALLSVKGK